MSKCDITNNAHQIQMTTICHSMKPSHENFLRTPLRESANVLIPAVKVRSRPHSVKTNVQ